LKGLEYMYYSILFYSILFYSILFYANLLTFKSEPLSAEFN